ncbi:putative oligopeptide transporter, OPT family [Thermodesulfobium acidiphilum]|uniref:Putative oligopeptide transporter, OPT family n=1 Tax=Thermodesulfobium acidiphilum TaxID=1794699 RepID=A0A2R4W0I1_THEAF|nr:oligopeptide transporter, OPT family [Thermodesulfobium acidiphilum]AWB10188.1 putative oligopeptide transporter, OPT family [Thermodesulfobium acidiphilum]
MEERKKLNYLNVSGEDYVPYISADKVIPEFTITAIAIGVFLAILFGAADAYLGMKAGLTVSASIPAAVMSMGVLKGIFRRGTILENTIAQTIASAGEAIASGVIFTLPALFIWGYNPGLLELNTMALLGGILGVVLMVPLRKLLIVNEHHNLPYPEGTACAEVLVAGDQGGSSAKTVFCGIGIGALYQFLMDGLGLWNESPDWGIPGLKGAGIGFDTLPALLGVGFIIGPKASFYMFAGGILSWLVLMPLISYFGSGLTTPIYPSTVPISQMGYWALWSTYIRYVGAGAVAVGGFITLIRSLPTILGSFDATIKGLSKNKGTNVVKDIRTQRDTPFLILLIIVGIIFFYTALTPQFNIGFLGAFLMLIFAFFFTTVSSRIVGIIGSSSNPVSGMTIGTIILVAVIFRLCGWIGDTAMVATLITGALVCISICVAGDTSQDLKTAFLVGGTPRAQQYGMIIGAIASSFVIGSVLVMLGHAYGFGTKDLPAPQAMLMALIIKGVIGGTMPWALVAIGGFVAIAAELLGISVLAFAVGMYLPISTSAAIATGGFLHLILSKTVNNKEKLRAKIEEGVLLNSGLIAGGSLMGVILAFLVYENINISVNFTWGGFVNPISLLFYFLLAIGVYVYLMNKKVEVE